MKKIKTRPDDIDEYIEAMREPCDGVLSETEQILYNIIASKSPQGMDMLDVLHRMIAYDRVKIEQCHWRYPDKKGQLLNKIRINREWKEFCKTNIKRGKK